MWSNKYESPCMKNESCSKHSPKKFIEKTTTDEEGYLLYRRRNDGRIIVKKKVALDNRFVVPYNLSLLLKYKAHINIELCNHNRSIKYLFKYVNKDHDKMIVTFFQYQSNDDC